MEVIVKFQEEEKKHKDSIMNKKKTIKKAVEIKP